MDIAVHGRHIELTDTQKRLAHSKVEHLGKYVHGMERAELLFSDGKRGHLAESTCCELVMHGHGHVVRAEGVGTSPEVALDAMVDKAAHRLTRLKSKLVARSRPRHKVPKGAASNGSLAAPDLAEAEIEGIEEL